ncbi:MAG: DnaJ C-terminal domain-containing protein [Gammaproteobacteria bacterium]|nr:DnaJ C-terminal domain-containing protein [Gammaproteobacteria bacterium]
MDFKDYYAVMGVERDATQDEIKRAYRRLARKYHPDVSKESGAEARFKAVGEAYEVLKDPEKRAAYDQLGTGWRDGQEFRPPPGWDAGFEFSGGGFSGSGQAGFSDFFESLFGGLGGARHGGFTRGARSSGRGEDHHSTVEVALEDAYHGATLPLQLRVPEYDANGRLSMHERRLQVKVPRGVINGKRIRLPGQGAKGVNGGKPGDLFLEIRLRPHSIYQVDGKHIYLNLPVAPWEAALGARIQVPTLGGRVDLNVPAGARSGQKLRLKGRGMPVPGESPGDQYVVVQIVTPPADSDEKREFYATMAERLAFNPRAHLGG